MTPKLRLLLSCEHASPAVPAKWRSALRSESRWLPTHRGWDPGAAEVARHLRRRFGAPLHLARWTRLLCDLNRDEQHPRVLGPPLRRIGSAYRLDGEQREALLQRYHRPYRQAVELNLRRLAAADEAVLHLSLHSFTPRLHGQVRACDLGIMFDPARECEAILARKLRTALQARAPRLRVRLNYPYRGASRYFQAFLRRRLPAHYLGLQLEWNQRLPRQQAPRWKKLQAALADSLEVSGVGRYPRGRAQR